MLRDPVKRIASQVRHSLYDGWGKSLDDGLTEDLIDFSLYAMQIDRFLEVFPRDSLLILTLEEFQADPYPVMQRVCDFLGIPPHRFVGAEERRNTGDFYTIPPIIAAVARNPLARSVVNRFLPRDSRHKLRERMARLGRRAPEPVGRWQLNEEETALVRERLADDMARLRDHYGVSAAWLRS